jgi:hypothetical protein
MKYKMFTGFGMNYVTIMQLILIGLLIFVIYQEVQKRGEKYEYQENRYDGNDRYDRPNNPALYGNCSDPAVEDAHTCPSKKRFCNCKENGKTKCVCAK